MSYHHKLTKRVIVYVNVLTNVEYKLFERLFQSSLSMLNLTKYHYVLSGHFLPPLTSSILFISFSNSEKQSQSLFLECIKNDK